MSKPGEELDLGSKCGACPRHGERRVHINVTYSLCRACPQELRAPPAPRTADYHVSGRQASLARHADASPNISTKLNHETQFRSRSQRFDVLTHAVRSPPVVLICSLSP